MFLQLDARSGPGEEPRGDADLMEFYNLLRLHNHLTSSTQIGNFHKQLQGTMFSSYYWYGGEDCCLAAVADQAPSGDVDYTMPLNHTFKPQPGSTNLTEAEKGPLVETLALGDPVVLQPEVKKRQRESPEGQGQGKAKKSKKEKKPKKDKSEKRKRSSERPSQGEL